MVGFMDFSDTDESAVDEIISQAKDTCVLDQLSAINCSGITDTLLPTHLETRFRNLKSFPPTKSSPKTPTFSTFSSTNPTNTVQGNHKSPNFLPSKENPDSGYPSSPGKNGPRDKTKDGSVSVCSPPFGSGSASSPSSQESSMSELFRPTRKDCSKQNTVASKSPSPPRRRCCLWISPKKKSKENWGHELLSELGSFSMKEQQKILKKAMKEEEKVSREAEKIVQWAKQASARMNVKDIEDDLNC
ncbi:hypothetical protein CR513_10655, partial [Mucuna pruriens]